MSDDATLVQFLGDFLRDGGIPVCPDPDCANPDCRMIRVRVIPDGA